MRRERRLAGRARRWRRRSRRERWCLPSATRSRSRSARSRASAIAFISNPWGSGRAAAVERSCRRAAKTCCWSAPASPWSTSCCRWTRRAIAAGSSLLSRRGLIPRSHADFEPAPVELEDVPSGDLRALLRWLRRRSGRGRLARGGRQPAAAQPRAVAKPRRRAAAPLPAPCAAVVGRPSPPHRARGRRARRAADRRGAARDRRRAASYRRATPATALEVDVSAAAARLPVADDELRLRVQLHRPAARDRAHAGSAAAQPARRGAGPARPSRHRP